MSAPFGPGPSFWNLLITSGLRLGQTITRATVANEIGAHVRATTGKTLSARTLDSSATAFLGTYAKTDALGRLGLLSIREESKGAYDVVQPDPPPLWAIAYALADYWENGTPNTSELLLKDLGRPDALAGIFFMGSGMFGALLSELQSFHIIAIKRDAPPFVVTRLWSDSSQILDRLYD
jgi:hypothetical protein